MSISEKVISEFT